MSDGGRGRYDGSEVAVIGMSCRFPGAGDVEQFWQNLHQGVESITRLSDEELLQAGVPQEQIDDPRYVKAAALLEGAEEFDASFFGYNALEARLMDPQQRVFLECCWHALEQAGYAPSKTSQRIGVFAGSKTNTYLFHLASHRELLESMDMFQLVLGGDQAMLATRASYKFDLKGPSYSVQTACSSSLVAIHLACQSLLLDECGLALAGGVAVNVPQKAGYLYQEGGILSPDGHCRAFDAQAAGTIFGSGAGVVVLKRLEEALADGDPVYAVILGSATNNDGSLKANFTAPSVEGQLQVILEALACSGAEPDSISYLETHGTGTQVGDPIEILALSEAFRSGTDKKGFCAIGSVKANLGHLDAAAGISSFIKTVLALDRGWLPPSLHYQNPNPRIDFENSPFYVNSQLKKWPRGSRPRRAGVSSFGFGGTNSHLVLEEAPAANPSGPSRLSQLLILSARSPEALQASSANLATHFREHPQLNLADAAYTLQLGRQDFRQRRFLVCRSLEEAAQALECGDPARLADGLQEAHDCPIAFLFPGQGAQYPGMAAGLYESEPDFRQELDQAAEILKPLMGVDLREVVYAEVQSPKSRSRSEAYSLQPAAYSLDSTAVTQAAVFVIEYALARLLTAWGLKPSAMIGHSIGEYAAACLAGVVTLEEALRLVAARGRLMQALPAGAMLSVSLPEGELEQLLGSDLSLAAVNGPASCAASGPLEEIEKLEGRLKESGVKCRRLHTSHAFHSAMMEPALEPFRRELEKVELKAPQIPYLSNLTGGWITAAQATDPVYWTEHLRRTVRFSQGLKELLQDPRRILLEVGPGTTLSSLSRKHEQGGQRAILSTLRHPNDRRDDLDFLLHTLGRLWLSGASIDWKGFWRREERRRLTLPGYPFQRKRYWIDLAPSKETSQPRQDRVSLEKKPDLSEWFYRPVWRRTDVAAAPNKAADCTTLMLGDEGGLAAALAQRLEGEVWWASAGDAFRQIEPGRYGVRPSSREDLQALLEGLDKEGCTPEQIVHLWSLNAADPLEHGFYSLLALAQALGRRQAPMRLCVLTSRSQPVTADEEPIPERAALLGPLRVLPKEAPQVSCRLIDLDEAMPEEDLAAQISAELTVWRNAAERGSQAGTKPSQEQDEAIRASDPEPPSPADRTDTRRVSLQDRNPSRRDTRRVSAPVSRDPERPGEPTAVAFRQGERWVEEFEPLRLEGGGRTPLRRGGVYLITGGLGGLGMVLAAHLAQTLQARLVLTGRSKLPPRPEWPEYLKTRPPDDRLAAKIRRLMELESAGAQVLALSADAADLGQMQQVFDAALAEFGRIDGIIHAAGIAGGGLMQLKTTAMADAVLRPKIRGAQVLERLLETLPKPPDFLAFFSSLQTVLGDFGQSDYAAANAYLDAMAHNLRCQGHNALSIGWDNWQEVGIAVDTQVPGHLKEWRQELLEKAITSTEGVEVFERALASASELPRLLISTQQLEPRIELSRSFTGGRIVEELAGGPAPKIMGKAVARPARRELQKQILQVWKSVLEVEEVGIHDNFFDLGGNSLAGMQLISELNRQLQADLSPVQLFEAPTPAAVLELLAPGEAGVHAEAKRRGGGGREGREAQGAVAVVGMAGRFPGAEDVEQLWENLCRGVESIRFFSDRELQAAGVPDELLRDPNYVKARPVLEGADLFDAAFFGYSPRDARIMDPQQRVFLECCWQALEDAGRDPLNCPGPVGVYAGSSISSYLRNLYANPDFMRSVGDFQALIGNEKDSLPMRVSYKLNLQGPSLAVQTFCSTSLVAVHLACRSLLEGECEMALAGGVSIHFPQTEGYLYDESGGVSPDGHLRAFDAQAGGYIFGSGSAVVVLRRLDDALADGDPVRAVVLGSAVTNDGALKAGYTATAVEGQAAAVAQALARSGAAPQSIGYLEAHGSGTPLGDPVEVTALSRVYGNGGQREARCPIGSLKTNLGHLDRAAGAAGLIKAVLALERGKIPPSLHFETPNPNIDFESSPFAVSTRLSDFPSQDRPRRAAVNSLGLGGTNAHLVLEQAPAKPDASPSRPFQLLLLSARTDTALEAATGRLAQFLKQSRDEDLPDAAYTLQTGRHGWESRRMLVCCDRQDALQAIESREKRRLWSTACRQQQPPPVAFLLPGLGGQYPGMARRLYEQEEVFRQELDRCAQLLQPLLGEDILGAIYPAQRDEEKRSQGEGTDLRRMLGRGAAPEDPERERLSRTRLAQPAIFALEYALARLWMSWGVRPDALIGYSVGEYAAACLAGMLRLEDALQLVARRAELIEQLPAGAMLSVPFSEQEAQELLSEELWLAAVNGPGQSVLAGSLQAVEALQDRLDAQGESCRRLQANHAFHTPMLEPIAQELTRLASGFSMSAPRIPVVSNLTGDWMSPEEAPEPGYWAQHACRPVQFGPGVEKILQDPDQVLLEAGPGQTLGSLALQCVPRGRPSPPVLASLRHDYESRPDQEFLLETLGKLWLLGVQPDWAGFYQGERRRRLSMPTYPFERRRFWVDPAPAAQIQPSPERIRIFSPSWKRSTAAHAPMEGQDGLQKRWLIFQDSSGLGEQLARRLKEEGAEAICVRAGAGLEASGPDSFTLDPSRPEDCERLLGRLEEPPEAVLHLWSLDEARPNGSGREVLQRGLESFSALAGALSRSCSEKPAQLWAVTRSVYEVAGDEPLDPLQAAAVGLCQAVPLRFPGVVCRCLEIGAVSEGLSERILQEVRWPRPEQSAALRGPHRWTPILEELQPSPPGELPIAGAYLLCGMLQGASFRFARRLAEWGATRLVLAEPADPAEGEAQRLHELESSGCEVQLLRASLSDRTVLREALQQARQGRGGLQGVVFSAEAAFAQGDSRRVGTALLELEQGLRTLDDLLKEDDPTLRLLLSLSASAGGMGLEAGFASNLFLESYAHASRRRGQGWTSLHWDVWDSGGESQEAQQAFRAVLSLCRDCAAARLLVSSRPLGALWNRLVGLEAETGAEAASEDSAPLHPRPQLRVEYVEPETDTQRAVAAVWQELLGIERVGLDDGFLELGGDSLLASRLAARLQDVLQIDLPVRLFFEASTVRDLAQAVEDLRSKQQDRELKELFEHLKGLSDEEVQRELEKRGH